MRRDSVSALLVASLIVLGAALPSLDAHAEDKPIVAVTPEEAGPDFAIQGEYTGEVKHGDVAAKVGVQVIALGKGKFHAVGYIGGLPGDGWDRKEKKEADGELKDGVVTFQGEKGLGEIKDGALTVKTAGGDVLGTLKRVVRKSPTLGAKAPEKAVILFDGTSADLWKDGRTTKDGLLMEGTTSKPMFQSFTLHLEFMLSFMPEARGQGRANSGVYMQGRYETQVLDSFGLAGKDNECGGIYSVKDSDVNMCFPPLSWQTYDVDFTAAKYDEAGKKTANARMTVKLNGVVIHNDVEVPKSTTAAPVPEGPAPGPIYLQNHGNPIRFRNIWLLEKK
ncbi:MAG: DUF1080 domain-containing protein [Planctomycetaceae bacterium]|nr:DUF1080 domain-containing protein [Planctomycetaceae bacterium]